VSICVVAVWDVGSGCWFFWFWSLADWFHGSFYQAVTISIPKRIYTIFKTRRKFEIKDVLVVEEVVTRLKEAALSSGLVMNESKTE
jgi:hypothetical protein